MQTRQGDGPHVPGYKIETEKQGRLGEGTYGAVYRAQQESTGRMVAIKKQHDMQHEKGIPSCVLRETALLTVLKDSPYVVDLHETHIDTRKPGPFRVCMIFELLNHDLQRYASVNRPLCQEKIQRIMYHMLIGIMHCHACGIMHRDLKPANILIDCSNPDLPNAKIADMGFGRSFFPPIRPLTEEIVTLWYRAPEVLLGYVGGHSPAVDMWSIGCIFAELCENTPLFSGSSEYDQLIKIFSKLGTPTQEQWSSLHACKDFHDYPKFKIEPLADKLPSMDANAIDLVTQMLAYNPCERIAAHQALCHPYFDSIFRAEDLEIKGVITMDTVNRQQHERNVVHVDSQPAVRRPVLNPTSNNSSNVDEGQQPRPNPLRPIVRN